MSETANKATAPLSFQDMILTLHSFWSKQGCVILQPYDMRVGAGTFHPATALRALGPQPWNAAYVQPSRRPTDGRYGENPNRLQHYYQYQVIMKPSPANLQELSRMTGNRQRLAHGAWVGKCGAMAWKSRNSPISSKWAAMIASRLRAN